MIRNGLQYAAPFFPINLQLISSPVLGGLCLLDRI
jgi:hypothetical protein